MASKQHREPSPVFLSKSGDCPDKPIMVTPSYVLGDMWGILQYSSPLDVNVPYTGEIIFFEIREGWDHS